MEEKNNHRITANFLNNGGEQGVLTTLVTLIQSSRWLLFTSTLVQEDERDMSRNNCCKSSDKSTDDDVTEDRIP